MPEDRGRKNRNGKKQDLVHADCDGPVLWIVVEGYQSWPPGYLRPCPNDNRRLHNTGYWKKC